jgi:hypothetical protein
VGKIEKYAGGIGVTATGGDEGVRQFEIVVTRVSVSPYLKEIKSNKISQ